MKRFAVIATVSMLSVVSVQVAGASGGLRGSLLSQTVPVLEATITSLVNADRRAAGLHELTVNSWAAGVARAHSEDMADSGEIWHNQQYFSAGRSAMGATLLGENVAMSLGAMEAQVAFMGSEGHRNNILDPRFTHIGVGVAFGEKGLLFVTQAFARISNVAPVEQSSGAEGAEPGLAPTGRDQRTAAAPEPEAQPLELVPAPSGPEASDVEVPQAVVNTSEVTALNAGREAGTESFATSDPKSSNLSSSIAALALLIAIGLLGSRNSVRQVSKSGGGGI
ncbi:MAG TPA: CAP domain-containing protein [Actinomycetota bacterium]|nr:CAP domain-containing protein [Actinomycetota bacterium]